jgi:hypothetical protein
LHLPLILYIPFKPCIPASPSTSILAFQHGIPLGNLLYAGQQTLGLAFKGHANNVVTLTDRIHYRLIIVAFNGPENSVRVIQPRRWYVRNKKLGPIGTGAGVGHGELSGSVVTQTVYEFVSKTVAGAAGARTLRAAALDHEIFDNTVKG